jgi:cyclic GMP-AMP synthase DncV-like protein
MPNDKLKRYSDYLASLAGDLDIPPSTYQKAVRSYKAVGEWLNGGEYEGSLNGVSIHAQGSFELGTVIKPLKGSKKAGYDIDLVCQPSIPKDNTTPSYIKEAIGQRLEENETYKKILDAEGKRCWTLEYAEDNNGIGFHLDVLPSVIESSDIIEHLRANTEHLGLVNTAIAITNKDSETAYSWSTSNPRGYSEWFKNINGPVLQTIAPQVRQGLFESNRLLFASVDQVPDQLIRTPLQQAVQIMKRHRDIRFSGHGHEDFKPISMIITTLAAHLYENEGDVFSALNNIAEKLRRYSSLMESRVPIIEGNLIQKKADGTWYIGNPVNGLENFADRWHEEDNARAEAFFEWTSWVSADLIEIAKNPDLDMILGSAHDHFEEHTDYADDVPVKMPAASAIIKPHIEIKEPSKPWCNMDVSCRIWQITTSKK